MKTIALTLFAAALAFAQSGSPANTTPAQASNKDSAKTAKKDESKKTVKAAQQKPPQQKPPAKAEPPVQTIPAGAKEIEPNLYRYTDANGKTWNYRQTPFGINRWEQTSTPEPQTAPQPAPQSNSQSLFQSSQVKTEPITVIDQGDSYRFDKKTPFGHSTWVHKKSDLTDEDKAAVTAQQAQSTPDSASTTKPAGN